MGCKGEVPLTVVGWAVGQSVQLGHQSALCQLQDCLPPAHAYREGRREGEEWEGVRRGEGKGEGSRTLGNFHICQ